MSNSISVQAARVGINVANMDIFMMFCFCFEKGSEGALFDIKEEKRERFRE
jgi:hypothetical protein